MSATVELVLDTRGPELAWELPSSAVAPPDELVAALTASEPIGTVFVALTDSMGALYVLGAQVVEDRIELNVPTVGLPTGPAVLSANIADQVGNVTSARATLTIDRPRVIQIDTDVEPVLRVALGRRRAMDLTISTANPVDLFAGRSVAVDIEPTPGPVIVIETAVRDANG